MMLTSLSEEVDKRLSFGGLVVFCISLQRVLIQAFGFMLITGVQVIKVWKGKISA